MKKYYRGTLQIALGSYAAFPVIFSKSWIQMPPSFAPEIKLEKKKR